MTLECFAIGTPEELIHRRRRQVLLHSVLYYRMDCSVISDNQFDELAKDLAGLQKKYPEASKNVQYHQTAFQDFEGETGYHLPLWDFRVISAAYKVWAYYERKRKVGFR